MYEIVIVITIVCNKRSVKIKNNRLGVEEKDCEKDKDLWVVVTAGLGRSGAFVPPLFPAYHLPTLLSVPVHCCYYLKSWGVNLEFYAC